MDLRISVHAVKQAKVRLDERWKFSRRPGESFIAWLSRHAESAISKGSITAPDRRRLHRITFVYDFATEPVTLITVLTGNHQKVTRYGRGRKRHAILSERSERMLERGARLARGEDVDT